MEKKNLWLPFMHDGKFYATCSDCNCARSLEEAKMLKKCPVCAREKKGIDESTWIVYHGEPLLTPGGDGLYICPKCLNRQCNGVESFHDIHVCQNCGQELNF